MFEDGRKTCFEKVLFLAKKSMQLGEFVYPPEFDSLQFLVYFLAKGLLI